MASVYPKHVAVLIKKIVLLHRQLLLLVNNSNTHTYKQTNVCSNVPMYEGRTESHEQLFFARELGTADEGERGGRWKAAVVLFLSVL